MTAEIQDNLLINKNPRNLSEVISEHTISTDFEIDKMIYKSALKFPPYNADVIAVWANIIGPLQISFPAMSPERDIASFKSRDATSPPLKRE